MSESESSSPSPSPSSAAADGLCRSPAAAERARGGRPRRQPPPVEAATVEQVPAPELPHLVALLDAAQAHRALIRPPTIIRRRRRRTTTLAAAWLLDSTSGSGGASATVPRHAQQLVARRLLRPPPSWRSASSPTTTPAGHARLGAAKAKRADKGGTRTRSSALTKISITS
ncbi:hypothetical protein OsJ_25634 [Oryza sativa Japonica Group]|uniref:Uncharacterized protein n=1 Tax=Oryza sativa subsp. japonica TaxID=39947 RepID=B9FUY7_ORYSJ|nr:hypothetical protein OsJ_25634 [Oryza sativa Japonica Group]